MGPPSDFRLSVPHSTIATVSGTPLPSWACRASRRSAWRAPSATANLLGRWKGSKPCRLRPVGSTAVVRSRSPPGAGRTNPPSSAWMIAGSSWSVASRASRRARSTGSVTPAKSSISMRSPGLGGWPMTCRPLGIRAYSSSSSAAPRRAISAGASVQAGSASARFTAAACACISMASCLVGIRVRVRVRAAPAVQRRLQVQQPAIQPGVRHRRRQVADQHRVGPALGDHALARVVRRIQVEVRQVPDQPVRPACRR